MAQTLEQLRAQRDALIRAAASGTRSVRFADRSVEYVSIADMRAAIALLDEEIAVLSPSSAPDSFVIGAYGRS